MLFAHVLRKLLRTFKVVKFFRNDVAFVAFQNGRLERTDSDANCADVRSFVDLEHGVQTIVA